MWKKNTEKGTNLNLQQIKNRKGTFLKSRKQEEEEGKKKNQEEKEHKDIGNIGQTDTRRPTTFTTLRKHVVEQDRIEQGRVRRKEEGEEVVKEEHRKEVTV